MLRMARVAGPSDWFRAGAGPGRHVDLTSPRGYYLDYSSRADYPFETDAQGVPLWRSGGTVPYSPTDVAQFALGNLERYLESGSLPGRRLFEASVRCLMRTFEEVPGGFVGWPMPTAPRAYREALGDGWFSGMAQGEIISVLVRAETLFGIKDAMELAGRALTALDVPVEDGGLLREIGDPGAGGGLERMAFAEEYPMPSRPSLVLNGHVHALWGIYDYLLVAGDERAQGLFQRCVRGLEYLLERYDLGYWTRYDLDEGWRGVNVASPMYHRIHIGQMKWLARITGKSRFEQAASRWERYAGDRRCARRAYWAKVLFKLRNRDSLLG